MEDISPAEILEVVRAGKASPELKHSLARGVLPLGPAPQLEVLLTLMTDGEETIRTEAVKSIKRIPKTVVAGVCSSNSTPPPLLDKLARLFSKNAELLEGIILNSATGGGTAAYVATLSHVHLLEIIGRNEMLLAGEPGIIEAMKNNPATPANLLSLWVEREARRAEAERKGQESAREEPPEEELPADLPPILVEESEDADGNAGDEGRPAEEVKRQTIHQLLKSMSAGHKVALAVKGNGEVRQILIRDKNRLIAAKVLENPRVTDSEIESFARSTNVSEDVLRTIGNTREWVRQPTVMKALLNNAKTPLGISLGFVKMLNRRELEGLSKNRNIPEALRNTARKMFKQKLETNK